MDMKIWIFERRVHQLGSKFSWSGISCNPNLDFDFIKNNLNKPWNWINLSCNGIIPIDFAIEQCKLTLSSGLGANREFLAWTTNIKPTDFGLSQFRIRSNKYITFDILLKYGTKSDFWEFSYNPNLQIKDIVEYLDMSWDWSYISQHQNISTRDIFNYIYLPWNWDSISKNCNLKFSDVLFASEKPWNWDFLSRHPNFNVDDIIATVDLLPWNFKCVSTNSTLETVHVLNNPDLSWDWNILVAHKNITYQDIKTHSHLPWGEQITLNIHITLDDIVEKETWDWLNSWNTANIFRNPTFDISWVLAIPNLLQRESFQVSLHKNIKWEDITRHPTLPWNFYGLSMNPNITIKTILTRLHLAWDFYYICNRKEFLDPIDDIEKQLYSDLIEWDCDFDL